MHIVAATPAATNNVVDADFDQVGSTSFANIAYASIAAGYNDFTLDVTQIKNGLYFLSFYQNGVKVYGRSFVVSHE
jgi:hypothetical protein